MIANRRLFLTNAFGITITDNSPQVLTGQVPSLACHAANRLMFGPRPGEVEQIEAKGFDNFLSEQLNPESVDDSACDAILATLPLETLKETFLQLYDRRDISPYSEQIRPINEQRHASLARMINSRRQLFERVVYFWHDHFNVYGFDSPMRSIWPHWDSLIRRNALGNFRVFLEETAKHTCMLRFLDNYLSTSAGPNENYARELFELHTLGDINYNRIGGYTDEDVYEASRCFTGWTYERGSAAANRGEFKYVANDHDRFQKYVLGKSIPRDQAPMRDGLDVLDLLANHPGTAQFIALKLCMSFVSDNPPQSIVDSTASVFHGARNDPDQIKQTLRHLFGSEEFKNARLTKFKRPIDWTVSMMRVLGIPYFVHESYKFEWFYDGMGQPLWAWRTPDGAPDVETYWATSNSFMRRWRLVFQISDNWYKKYNFAFNTDGLMPMNLTTPVQIADWWGKYIIQGPISSSTQKAMIEFLADGRNPNLALSQQMIKEKVPHLAALCTVTPEFMRR